MQRPELEEESMRKGLIVSALAGALALFAVAPAIAHNHDRGNVTQVANDGEIILDLFGRFLQYRSQREWEKSFCRRYPWRCDGSHPVYRPYRYRSYGRDCFYDRFDDTWYCRRWR